MDLWLYLVVVSLVTVTKSMERSSMYMKRKELNDQTMSGSGYSYSIQSGQPESSAEAEFDREKTLGMLKELGYHPMTIARYAEGFLPFLTPSEGYSDQSIYHERPSSFAVNEGSYDLPQAKVISHAKPLHAEYDGISYPYARGFNHPVNYDASFLKSYGKSYSADDRSKKGDHTKTGYNNREEFADGLKGKYDEEAEKSLYDQHGGKTASSYDIGGNYEKKHEQGKSTLGGSFSEKDGHKKGSRTNGYHKVFHKDEYKKQHKFYDEADRRGHFDKYEDYEAKHGASKGFFKKGDRADKGYHEKEYAVKGLKDKGRFDEETAGYKGASGNEKFYNDYADYAHKGGHERRTEDGYGERDKYGFGFN